MLCRRIGLANKNYFSPSLPLTIILDPDIQMVSRILVHPILVELIYHVVRYLEAGFQEVATLARQRHLQTQHRGMEEARPE